MPKSRCARVAFAADFVGTIEGSRKARNQRWAHTSLHRVLASPTTESTSAAAGPSIAAPSYMGFIGDRWKRFLSRVSLMDRVVWS
jgi:hypothetical protein